MTFAFHKKDLVLIGNLKQVIFTLQHTYIIHIAILSPIKNRSTSLWNPSLESFDVPDSYIFTDFDISKWFDFLFDSNFPFRFYFLILVIETDHSILKSIVEIRVAQRNHGATRKRRENEKTSSTIDIDSFTSFIDFLDIYSIDLDLFYHFSRLIETLRMKFL